MKNVSSTFPEIAELRKLPKSSSFLLCNSRLPRRLTPEDYSERRKGFSKIEVLYGDQWVPGYISHLTLSMAIPLNFI
jgi:hypothetical protein